MELDDDFGGTTQLVTKYYALHYTTGKLNTMHYTTQLVN